jgi:hypothetical protein
MLLRVKITVFLNVAEFFSPPDLEKFRVSVNFSLGVAEKLTLPDRLLDLLIRRLSDKVLDKENSCDSLNMSVSSNLCVSIKGLDNESRLELLIVRELDRLLVLLYCLLELIFDERLKDFDLVNVEEKENLRDREKDLELDRRED